MNPHRILNLFSSVLEEIKLLKYETSIFDVFKFILMHFNRKRKFKIKSDLLNFYEIINFIIDEISPKLLLKGKIATVCLDYTKMISTNELKNKVIVDVGSWKGDSILLFHNFGAKKIIAYEPIIENVKSAKRIIDKFKINCEIYPYAVCSKDGNLTFFVEEEKIGGGDLSLLENKRENLKKIKVKCISFEKVIRKAVKENCYLMKVDCEGCEKFLLDIDDKLIKKIPRWIIESHSFEISKKLCKNFIKNGFYLKKIYYYNPPELLIFSFSRK
ncbi:MAG: FkbM family methyltransferase [Candidatus Aenigmatarchaeota archaeon]